MTAHLSLPCPPQRQWLMCHLGGSVVCPVDGSGGLPRQPEPHFIELTSSHLTPVRRELLGGRELPAPSSLVYKLRLLPRLQPLSQPHRQRVEHSVGHLDIRQRHVLRRRPVGKRLEEQMIEPWEDVL